MDDLRFDHISRLIGTTASRRSGLFGALAMLAGAALGGGEPVDVAAEADEAADGATPASQPSTEKRPCGPSKKANRCKKDHHCCTGHCKKGKKDKNGKRKKGHCRCIKKNRKCKANQTCCGGGSCQDGRCTGAPACTVCESGCPFTSVNDAYAAASPGDTITIDAGTWTTGIVVDKDITLAACDASSEVILQADSKELSPYGYTFIVAEDGVSSTPYRVTLENLTLSGADSYTTLLEDYTIGSLSFTLTNVKGRNAGYFLMPNGGDHVLTNCETDASVYYAFYGDFDVTGKGSITVTGGTFVTEDNTFYVDGNRDPAQRAVTPFVLTDCTFTSVSGSAVNLTGGVSIFTNCLLTGSGDGGAYLDSGTFNFADTVISGNTSTGDYGGIYVWTNGYDASVTLTGSTSVTGNTATFPGGIGVYPTSGVITINGASSANVNGNIATYQCASYDGSTWTDVPNCAF